MHQPKQPTFAQSVYRRHDLSLGDAWHISWSVRHHARGFHIYQIRAIDNR